MDSGNLACSILQSLGIAVLQRDGPRRYTVFGEPPPFYQDFFPSENGSPCETPWEHSPMLEFFIDEVEQFFENGGEDAITSGVWQEDGRTDKNSAMLAMATIYGGQQVLIIRMLHEDYAERVGILRKAREQLLENRQLSYNLEIFREKSRVDGLTQIFNKATFSEILHDEIRRSQNLSYPLSMLLLDIDEFKKVNDTYGHPVGDKVLQALGALLKKTLRRNDIIARYGGEEFVVIIPHETRREAAKVAEKLRKAIESKAYRDIPSITVSIGCATHIPSETPEDFVERTDMALYDAKHSGKNIVCLR